MKFELRRDAPNENEKAYGCESVTADRRGLADRTTLDESDVRICVKHKFLRSILLKFKP